MVVDDDADDDCWMMIDDVTHSLSLLCLSLSFLLSSIPPSFAVLFGCEGQFDFDFREKRKHTMRFIGGRVDSVCMTTHSLKNPDNNNNPN